MLPRDGGEAISSGTMSRFPLRRGDVVRIATATGGGWGDPARRDRELVSSDVRNGFITAEEAREIYGAVIDTDGADRPGAGVVGRS